MHQFLLILAVFVACSVEAVEALTIVLAVGLTRGWRSALQGVGVAVLALAVVVAALGPALTVIPINSLRLVVGGLLLVFGLGWLRKAMLRASGFKAQHDEDAIYARELEQARAAAAEHKALVHDWYAFTLSFKGAFLEGMEVVFIVLTFGANEHSIGAASLGAVAAVVAVVVTGFLVRGPLSRVPENAMKFSVGVLLTSFGIFWGAEGAGAHWPGSDGALLAVIAGTLCASLAGTAILRRVNARRAEAAAPVPVGGLR
jgi:uncharacterized membrane protein